MAVFICAADESSDQNPRGNFFYGGFAAPVNDWDGVFAAAWNERVLQGPPQIPYLHMTDIRSRTWREKYGLSEIDANQRLDEASRVIRSMGSLIPVTFFLSEPEYDSILRRPFRPKSKQTDDTLNPDCFCFLFFVFTQLKWLRESGNDIDKVDFWVEQNGKITRYLSEFHKDLANNLNGISRPELAQLIGEFNSVGKDRIPIQAADMLAWHARNFEKEALNHTEKRRYWRMITDGNGSLSHGRYGHQSKIDVDLLRQLADRFTLAEQRSVSVAGGGV